MYHIYLIVTCTHTIIYEISVNAHYDLKLNEQTHRNLQNVCNIWENSSWTHNIVPKVMVIWNSTECLE